MTIALAGNPNVGKTTLFNAITGARQHVGNWPGVTVEKKTGKATHNGVEVDIVDLPGTYSLTAYSLDEVVARDYLVEEKPDVVVHIVDATNLERNLYLTTQLMELGVPVIIALNMWDLAESKGDKIDIKKMEEYLEIPVVKTVANKGIGIDDLLETALKEAGRGPHHQHEISYGDEIEEKVIELEKVLVTDSKLAEKYPLRWLAVKLLDGDEEIAEKISESSVSSQVDRMVTKVDKERYEAKMADKRYEVINAALPQFCSKCVKEVTFSDMVDRVVTNKSFGIPIFLTLMWAAFEVTFTVAVPFMEMVDMFFGWAAGFVAENISSPVLGSFLGDGIIAGVGSVLIFLPNIVLLFMMIALLGDSGYMARAAFIMDKFMYKIGLNGKSFIPMIMGFGCNVPAIMSTRTIEDEHDRLVTILVAPFISCGARLPVYILLAGAFFGRDAGAVIFGLYALGIIVAILSAKLFRGTLVKGTAAPFIMELPPYRMPTLKASAIHMWDKASLYIKKAGTIILLGVVIVWLLAAIPAPGVDAEFASEEILGTGDSMVGYIGQLVEPLVEPLGFDWRIAIALIFGFVAKEIVVGALGVIYGAGEDEDALTEILVGGAMNPLTALGLMVFTLLYMPCVACVGVIKSETGSWKWTLFSIVYGTALAWIAAFLIYNVGKAIGWGI
ncbi:ferrous iron transport protein B [Methanolobus sp. ZRKC2]|uniref:ferrous iron transport protein B n=1 Tax=Methanolobus sp. ZRKC2 TaxID=3125783 RepID=UPI003872BCDD